MSSEEEDDLPDSTRHQIQSTMKAGVLLGHIVKLVVIVSFLYILYQFNVNEEFLAMIAIIAVTTQIVFWAIDYWPPWKDIDEWLWPK